MNKAIFYLMFGFKNLWRRKKRTLILGISLFLVSLLIVLGIGYCLGVYNQLINSAKQNVLGEYVIFHKESDQNLLWPEKLVSFNSLNIIQYLYENNIKFWLQFRVKAFCYNEKYETFALLVGVSKNYMDKIKIIDGEMIDWANKEGEILITQELAENLKVKVGEVVIVEVVNEDGVKNFDYFKVKGIYRILGLPSLLGGHIILTNINQVQQLMLEEENQVTEIILEEVSNPTLLSKSLNNDNLLYQKWNKYGSLLIALVSVVVVSTFVMLSVLFLIVLIFLVDTLFVIIEERKKEFAYMLALGLDIKEITGVMLAEILSLLICFVLPAFIIGNLITYFLSSKGIPINSPAMSSMLGGYEKLYFYLNPFVNMFTFFVLVLIMSAAVIFPIQKIFNWKIVELLKE